MAKTEEKKPGSAEQQDEKAKMKRICAWCGKVMGEKDAEGLEGEDTHGICDECLAKLNEEGLQYVKEFNERKNRENIEELN